jgi:hypothetical protein
MALVAVPGAKTVFIGPNVWLTDTTPTTNATTVIDAANEASIAIGRMEWADGGTHTVDTSGSSSIQWRTGGTLTFANGSTVVKVGIGAALATAGPPARAANAADVITFDVNASFTGGGGGITGGAWQTSVPTSGTKTIANGDLIAVSIQMTARGGADTLQHLSIPTGVGLHRPTLTSFTGAAYAVVAGLPNFIIVASDGTVGWLQMSDISSSRTVRTWNSGSSPAEYGQLYNLPFPCKIYGIYGWLDPDADTDVVLYSAPLSGSPVAEKTLSIDLNVTASATGRRFAEYFAAPYTYAANSDIAVTFKPGASSISAYYKTLGSATHRVADSWGASGYGVSRASGGGAFANANSSLDHYYIGLIAGAFESGVWPSGHLGV